MQIWIKTKAMLTVSPIMLVISFTFILMTNVTPLLARDMVSDCKYGFLNIKKCSDHQFLESLLSLKYFKNKTYPEVRKTIRCLDKQDEFNENFFPDNCGKMYGRFIKDVSVSFEKEGWLRPSYVFDEISFKIIAGKDLFDNLITYVKELEGVSLIKVDSKNLIKCEKRKIWKDDVYEFKWRGWDYDRSQCTDDPLDCVHNKKTSMKWEPTEMLPVGLVCTAKGFFQDERGFIEGTVFITYSEIDDSDFKNTTITYYPSEIY